MNVRLQIDLDFLASIYYEERLQMSNYSLNINLLTNTNESQQINIAMDRLKCFIYGQMESTVFINNAQSDRAELMNMIGINVTTLPEDPVDQIVGMMLYYKLNAIMEDRIKIVQIHISSTMGDNVWYVHDSDNEIGPFEQSGWWNDVSPKHSEFDVIESEPKVFKINQSNWREFELEWPGNSPNRANTVVFGNFPKNED